MKAQVLIDQLLDEAIPQMGHYYFGKSGQPRPNATVVTVGDLTIWFSYYTPIAFRKGTGPVVASENKWGPTTGKHLKLLGIERKRRLSRDEFEKALEAAGGGEVSMEPEQKVPEGSPEGSPEGVPAGVPTGEEV